MPVELQTSSMQNKLPLQGVVIFVSQQLVTNRMALHEQCTELGGKFVWMFDVPFTHYICKGKLTWLKACQTFGQRVAEKLYASTYNPNKSLNFISAGDEDDDDDDEENNVPSLTTKATTVRPMKALKPVQTLRSLPTMNKKQTHHLATHVAESQVSSPKVIPTSMPPPPSSSLSQNTSEAETMLNDLESSLAQFLNNNTSISRASIVDDEQTKKSLPVIRSISNMKNDHNNNIDTDIEPSMRVEWLDDAMQAERQKMIDEDEHNASSQQKQLRSGEAKTGKKRPLIDSNFDQSFNAKKCRT
ncbi:unnamed protein product [Adineta ricciae]|uniref:BRCT domain-containing protein n=1 Tax=Adineta ricciae TaxID=249248 RepID=A0A813WND8_ADIRI|nr:unnamed protein product [Adineta ricciae]